MGEINNVMNHYMRNAGRFADFVNGVMFAGRDVVHPDGLRETSEKYDQHTAVNPDTKERGRSVERIRDLKMLYEDEICLRILGVEGQDYIDYGCGVRGAEYDIMEYRSQMQKLKVENEHARKGMTKSELFSGLKRTDRLIPTYTIWFYYGTEQYDGPYCLADMMHFPEQDVFRKYFSDYRLNVICLNKIEDMTVFHTEIRQLFKLMKYRGDGYAMRSLLEDDEDYKNVDEDTLYAMSVMVDRPRIWTERDKYLKKDEVKYNMCLAFDQIEAEEREKGREEGDIKRLLHQICKKLLKGKELDEIAEDLEEEAEDLQMMYDVALGFAPDYNVEDVYRAYRKELDAVVN